MKRNPRILIPIGVALLLVAGGAAYTFLTASSADPQLKLSGTIEAIETRLSTKAGGQVETVNVNEGDSVQKWEILATLYSDSTQTNETIASPLDGVVLERLIEPDELTMPGSTVLVVASLDTLTLTVYVPEDQYGQIFLGETVTVNVDSFPGEAFQGTVSHISDKAEFTPRNVQTTEGRKTTVFAVRLDLAPSGGKLKPGMPADVYFPISH